MVMRNPLDLPPAVACAFVKNMKAFFAEQNRYNRTKREPEVWSGTPDSFPETKKESRVVPATTPLHAC